MKEAIVGMFKMVFAPFDEVESSDSFLSLPFPLFPVILTDRFRSGRAKSGKSCSFELG